MLVRAHSFAIARGMAEHVEVELDVRAGLPSFAVVGLNPTAARDARERVHAALLNSGFGFPRKRVTVNLAPANTRRTGAGFDLALACCVLAAQDQLDPARLAGVGLFAELGLGGGLRPCPSAAAAALLAERIGLRGLVVAAADLHEAREACGLPVAGPRTLAAAAVLFAGTREHATGPVGGRRAPAAGSPGSAAPSRDAIGRGSAPRAEGAAQSPRREVPRRVRREVGDRG